MSAKDISRFLFQPEKRYSSVRMQQGRVILDSDYNESKRIDDEEARRILAETVCTKGTPNDGFLVGEVSPPYDFPLGSGSFYLGGLRFESVNEIVTDGPDVTERFLSQRRDLTGPRAFAEELAQVQKAQDRMGVKKPMQPAAVKGKGKGKR